MGYHARMIPSNDTQRFRLESPFSPTGDQPAAITALTKNLDAGVTHQTLLGVTGSGKTFTMANVIEKIQKPTLVISHNKTLAGQLYQEFSEFFPDNAVHYFVSYYDYYQPEAYIPQTDTYIEKDAKINEMIDGLRHASTASLLTRKDTIIVASVSCIYGVGSPEAYAAISMNVRVGQPLGQKALMARLIALRYTRNPVDPRQGHFRTRENTVEIHVPSGEEIISIAFEKNKVVAIDRRSVKSYNLQATAYKLSSVRLFPAKHFVTPQDKLDVAIANIKGELAEQLALFKRQDKVLEAARIKQRTEYDMEMLRATGYVNGIENYSRQLDFREAGTPPHTLVDYFRYAYGNDFLICVDESHATLPQIRGMERGDRARKDVLVNYGFRLPSAVDNRPLTFTEFNQRTSQVIYVSATPAIYELEKSRNQDPTNYNLPASTSFIVQQVIRPTGILDPEIEVRPTRNQVQDIIREIKARSKRGERSLVLALTKRLAEDIAEYLTEAGINAEYLHADIKTLERPGILKKLRQGEHDVIVGINLLREGLDLPEVSFIAILDADKEGFLRNETTLLQIIGRAARHTSGTVVLYGDTVTRSMHAAMRETDRRRNIQRTYNKEYGITPLQIQKTIRDSILETAKKDDPLPLPEGHTADIVKSLEREMKKAAKHMDFELAARLRDRIKQLTGDASLKPSLDK